MMMIMVQEKRTHILAELYDTEQSYVESLQFLVEVSEYKLYIDDIVWIWDSRIHDPN